MGDERAIAERYRRLSADGHFDERTRRLWAAAQARAAGFGGIAAVARATGISQATVRRGLRELDRADKLEQGRVRRRGAGRIRITDREPGLADDLERLIDPTGSEAQHAALRWTCRSAAQLAAALRARNHRVADRTVLRLLKANGYSLQANRRSRDGSRHPDRDAQFQYINRTVGAAIAAAQPAICVEVKRHGRASTAGWIQVGVTRETAQLTASVIGGWWERIGKPRFSGAGSLTITADFGGPGSELTRAWMLELQRISDRSGLELVVRHFPAATTRWTGVEHRLLVFAGARRRGAPPVEHVVAINSIARPAPGRPVHTRAWLGLGGRQIHGQMSDRRPATLNVARSSFQADWNYRLNPYQ